MFMATTSTIALRCPNCGKLEFYALSLFNFAGRMKHRISCECGTTLLIIGTKDRHQFWVQVDCVMCETKHLLNFSRKQLWSPEVVELFCDETGLEVGYIGPKSKVKQSIQRQDRSLADMTSELGVSDYFENPEIMYDVLERLYQMAETSDLHCLCGNQNIEIEVFPEHLELRCESCRASVSIWARTQDDLKKIQAATQVELHGGGLNIFQHKKGGKRKGHFKGSRE